jgi:hypothetical protein
MGQGKQQDLQCSTICNLKILPTSAAHVCTVEGMWRLLRLDGHKAAIICWCAISQVLMNAGVTIPPAIMAKVAELSAAKAGTVDSEANAEVLKELRAMRKEVMQELLTIKDGVVALARLPKLLQEGMKTVAEDIRKVH